MSQEFEKIKKTLLRLTEELEEKARKNDLERLEKQIRLFEPLKLLN